MKKKIPGILFGILFLIGFGILIYPTAADQWNTYRQSRLISSYEAAVEKMEPEDFSLQWEKARAFNDSFSTNNICPYRRSMSDFRSITGWRKKSFRPAWDI